MSAVFHPGEIAVQHLAGTRGAAEELGQVLAKELPVDKGNIRQLLFSMRLLFVASVTPQKRVWVSPIFGPEGFVRAPSAKNLEVDIASNLHPGDVLWSIAKNANTALGVLALNFERRVRWRTNGVLARGLGTSAEVLEMAVKEAFPNCPKYIARRVVDPVSSGLPPLSTVPEEALDISYAERAHLTDDDSALIQAADTFFLGTFAEDAGADVSHRGGRPGFVRVRSSTEIEFSDYRGNGMFQSFGNLQQSERAGICFVDFSTGRVLQITGRAAVKWDMSARAADVELATERLVTFHIDGVRGTGKPVTNFRWQELEPSPYNPKLRTAKGHTSRFETDPEKHFPLDVQLVKIVKDSSNVKTFRFLADKYIKYEPGQYCTLQFDDNDIPGLPPSSVPIVRTWTLSEVANSSAVGDLSLEISVKRKKGGLISEWLHDKAAIGIKASLLGVGGEMTLAASKGVKKFLMISAGIGITPNMAILRGLGAQSAEHDVVFIHQEREALQAPFQRELFRRTRGLNSRLICLVSGPGTGKGTIWQDDGMPPGGSLHIGRRVDRALLEEFGDMSERVAYICGPRGFMDSVSTLLSELGGAKEIVTEDFTF